MTTTVIVQANHGWPVDVTPIHTASENNGPTARVAPGNSQTFHVSDGVDLRIHEVQPTETGKGDPT